MVVESLDNPVVREVEEDPVYLVLEAFLGVNRHRVVEEKVEVATSLAVQLDETPYR